MMENPRLRHFFMFLLDVVLVTIAVYVSMELRFEMFIPEEHMATMLRCLPLILVIYMACFWLGGIYRIMWRFAGVQELIRLCVVASIACAGTLVCNRFLNLDLFRSVLILIAIFSMVFVGGIRLIWRGFTKERVVSSGVDAMPVMIVGAGVAGAYAVNICSKDAGRMGRPVLLVDDDPTKQGLRIRNVPVMGTIKDIPRLVTRYGIREIIVAIPSLNATKRMQEILDYCNNAHCHTRILSGPTDLGPHGEVAPPIRELNISDFLSRDEIDLKEEDITGYLDGKVVIVTGGGGSIGSELCRQILRFNPRLLIIFDIYENCAYELERELRQRNGENCPVITLIGSIRDPERLQEVFDLYHPEVVFHAAAHKHVPLMEKSPAEAIKNNVFGTRNLLEVASRSGVERFVQLSTDKAVNPVNVMGATKRITEMLIQYYGDTTDMKCMAVRFGNVLGSHGSVIPLMERQIRSGGPVTVTHPDVTRYFMTIPEAAQLVLQAGSIAQTGTIFVLDMGEPVRIMTLAEKLIRAYGYEPNVDIPIQITGLRQGEKLYEELLMDSERHRMTRTAHRKIFVANVDPVSREQMEHVLSELEACQDRNDEGTVEIIASVVPTYHPWKAEKAVSPVSKVRSKKKT